GKRSIPVRQEDIRLHVDAENDGNGRRAHRPILSGTVPDPELLDPPRCASRPGQGSQLGIKLALVAPSTFWPNSTLVASCPRVYAASRLPHSAAICARSGSTSTS